MGGDLGEREHAGVGMDEEAEFTEFTKRHKKR